MGTPWGYPRNVTRPCIQNYNRLNVHKLGSGCGSVGRAVTSDSRGSQFESSHRRKFIMNILLLTVLKDENKDKEAGNGPFF